MLDLHKKLSRPERVHLVGRNHRLMVASVTPSGLTLVTSLDCDAELNACVDLAALTGLVRATGDVEIASREGRLIVKGKGISGDVPSTIEDVPRVRLPEGADVMSDDDAEFLQRGLAITRLSALEREGLVSVECAGGQWSIGCADDVHGAFVFGEGRARVRFGMFPSDGDAVQGVLAEAEGRVTIGMVDGQLVVRSGRMAVSVPTTEPLVTSREETRKNASPVAIVNSNQLREVLSALSTIASAKDASPVNITVPERGGSIRISAKSPSGAMARDIPARVKAVASFNVSHRLVSDLLAHADGPLVIDITREGKEITQVNFRSRYATYCTLTASS
jgi:hypothetical protein